MKIKIINDPVYGFIDIDDLLILQIIEHPWFQRLRHIKQMAMAQLVYPGAVHTRLHHSLGAYHLMCLALAELKRKQIDITEAECQAAKAAALLHDIGHGPFSHALENTLFGQCNHETIGDYIVQQMNQAWSGALTLAIQILKNKYHKPFLHQLISSQIDVDRMDYLARDSFFTGVSEGVIGYDRLIKMINVVENEIVFEEKGIISVEKFLIARRQMYWQVYFHKTVLSSEIMLRQIMIRAKHLATTPAAQPITNNPSLQYFFVKTAQPLNDLSLQHFLRLDDTDIIGAIKTWATHPDFILKTLCIRILNRQLFKMRFSSVPFDPAEVRDIENTIAQQASIEPKVAAQLIFAGSIFNTLFSTEKQPIKIVLKNGLIQPIQDTEHTLIHNTLAFPIKKNYLCFLQL